MFINGIFKKTRSSFKGMIDNGTPSLSPDYEMSSKENKNRRSTFKIDMKMHFLSLKKQNDTLFKNRPKKTCQFTNAIKYHAQF